MLGRQDGLQLAQQRTLGSLFHAGRQHGRQLRILAACAKISALRFISSTEMELTQLMVPT